jgi:nucleoside 2-deoxyribosyltransferase
MKVYVAGPLGFTEASGHFYDSILLPRLREAGLEPLDPWAGGAEIAAARAIEDPVLRKTALTEANVITGERNAQLLTECAGVFAVLDGPDVDSGTAAEIGWAAAAGRPIVGWRSDVRSSGDNEGSVVNLQVEYFVHRSGGRIERQLGDAINTLRQILEESEHSPGDGG